MDADLAQQPTQHMKGTTRGNEVTIIRGSHTLSAPQAWQNKTVKVKKPDAHSLGFLLTSVALFGTIHAYVTG